MNLPKVLCLDIETFPMQAWVWALKDQYVSHSQINQDWTIAAWGAKWLNDPASKFIYRDQQKTELSMLKDLWYLLDKADFILTQNGKAFDWPKIQARMMMHGMNPPSFFQHVDVYKELKSVGFTSHSLDYLTQKFCTKTKKTHHSKYPGMLLWTECLRNNKDAWKEMKIYNKNDVLSTEELYFTVSKWLPKVVYKISHPVLICTTCGGRTFVSNGLRTVNHILYNRKICKSCGAWQKQLLKGG